MLFGLGAGVAPVLSGGRGLKRHRQPAHPAAHAEHRRETRGGAGGRPALLRHGAELGAQALRAGLIDECRLFIAPAVVGGGAAWLPDHVRLTLALLDERRFGNGMVYLRYRCEP